MPPPAPSGLLPKPNDRLPADRRTPWHTLATHADWLPAIKKAMPCFVLQGAVRRGAGAGGPTRRPGPGGRCALVGLEVFARQGRGCKEADQGGTGDLLLLLPLLRGMPAGLPEPPLCRRPGAPSVQLVRSVAPCCPCFTGLPPLQECYRTSYVHVVTCGPAMSVLDCLLRSASHAGLPTLLEYYRSSYFLPTSDGSDPVTPQSIAVSDPSEYFVAQAVVTASAYCNQ